MLPSTCSSPSRTWRAAGTPWSAVRPDRGSRHSRQYISQVHRSAFVPASLRPPNLPAVVTAALPDPRRPERLRALDERRRRLRHRVRHDDEDEEAAGREGRRSSTSSPTSCRTPRGAPVAPAEVQELFAPGPQPDRSRRSRRGRTPRCPEHGRCGDRQPCSPGSHLRDPSTIVVTTRPSTNELPEPSTDHFDIVVLSPLTPRQREDYLRRWSAVRDILGRPAATCERASTQRSPSRTLTSWPATRCS